MRPRLGRSAGFLLAALLAVPLLVHGHGHPGTDAMASPCAVCAVAHHAPAMQASAVAGPALVLHAVPVASTGAVAPPWIESRPHAGRGPPAPRPTHVS
jgi:hypothetical protein